MEDDEMRIPDQDDTETLVKFEAENGECPDEQRDFIGQFCRLCANTISSGIYIFSGIGREQHLADKINTCLPVTVKVTDFLPKQLCVPCRNKLNMCYDFAETCVNAEKKLKQILEFPISGTLCRYDDSNQVYCCPLCFEGSMILQTGIDTTCSSDDSPQETIDNDNEAISELINSNCEENSVCISSVTFLCRFCDHFCPDLNAGLSHSKCHANNCMFPCLLCESHFRNEKELEEHFINHTLDKSQNDGQASVNKLCKCSECGQIFGNFERLSFHIQFHKGAKPLICERCAKEFTSENLLFRHMNLVHGGTEMCKLCGATFMSKDKLDSHVCTPIKQPFRCKICNTEFEDTKTLRQHTATHNYILAKPFQCNKCDASFTRISRLNEHVEQLHCTPLTPQMCFKCSVCNAVFPNRELALLHVEKHSPCKTEGENIEEIQASMLFCCEYCESVFAHLEHILQHNSQHSGLNPYLCMFCDMRFPDHSQMIYHKKYHVEHEQLIDELRSFYIPIFFVCEACEKTFCSWKGLQIHYNVIHSSCSRGNSQNLDRKKQELVSHLCEDCGASFEKRVDLRRHKLKAHRPQNQYPCEECGKVLLHYSGLVIHRRQHTGEKPFMCDLCGKKFPQGPAMYTHRRTHTRDYPYKCDICGHRFNNKGDLNNHRRSKHTKERPFKCNVCNKSFLTSGVYYQHKQLHAGIRNYKCTHCDRAFSRWNALNIHIKSHTGEKPHACYVCGRGFAQKGDMKKHMKTQHGVTQLSNPFH